MSFSSPSAIFSPSAVRQKIANTKDWNYIDNWLASKYHGKIYERNHNTLKALLALAALNESADEDLDLMARVEAKALCDIQVELEGHQTAELLEEFEGALTSEGKTSLGIIADLSLVFDQPVAHTEKLGRSVIDLDILSYDLDQDTKRIEVLERHLAQELEQINVLVAKLQSEQYQPSSNISKDTTFFQQNFKALNAKLPELKHKVAVLKASITMPDITVEDVKEAESKLMEGLSRVRGLEGQVTAYHGLPQDTDLARLELEGARAEFRQLATKRDAMFENLVERESPKKSRN